MRLTMMMTVLRLAVVMNTSRKKDELVCEKETERGWRSDNDNVYDYYCYQSRRGGRRSGLWLELTMILHGARKKT